MVIWNRTTRALLLLAFVLLPLTTEATSAPHSSLDRISVLEFVGDIEFGHVAHGSPERPDDSAPLRLCRGEPVEMYASHSSCHRWRLVLAWSISLNPTIYRVEDVLGRILKSQKYRYPFDRPQVEPEQFYPQPREVRGDPVSRSALVCVRRSDLRSKDSISCNNGFVIAFVPPLA